MLSAIALYTLAAALLTVVPGPDNALLLRNTLRGGGAYAMATAAGCAIGLVCWGLIAAFGLTAEAPASASRAWPSALRSRRLLARGVTYRTPPGDTVWA